MVLVRYSSCAASIATMAAVVLSSASPAVAIDVAVKAPVQCADYPQLAADGRTAPPQSNAPPPPSCGTDISLADALASANRLLGTETTFAATAKVSIGEIVYRKHCGYGWARA